jgi:hypothetical protein
VTEMAKRAAKYLSFYNQIKENENLIYYSWNRAMWKEKEIS